MECGGIRAGERDRGCLHGRVIKGWAEPARKESVVSGRVPPRGEIRQRLRGVHSEDLPSCSDAGNFGVVPLKLLVEFRSPQTRKIDVCRHHHRAFGRSAICGAPNLREDLSHQRARRNRAALPDFSHRFRTPQIRKIDVCRHHHRAFDRSAICGALNLREISATSALVNR